MGRALTYATAYFPLRRLLYEAYIELGAVVGAGVGAYVGHEGTDANGHVSTSRIGDGTVRKAQAALNDKGYNVTVDGRFGPNTQSAVRSFQEKNGLVASDTLDGATLSALGVRS